MNAFTTRNINLLYTSLDQKSSDVEVVRSLVQICAKMLHPMVFIKVFCEGSVKTQSTMNDCIQSGELGVKENADQYKMLGQLHVV